MNFQAGQLTHLQDATHAYEACDDEGRRDAPGGGGRVHVHALEGKLVHEVGDVAEQHLAGARGRRSGREWGRVRGRSMDM